MEREALVKRIAKTLESYSYESVVISNMHASFDILARSAGDTLVIKAVYNIDTIDQTIAKDIADIAYFINAEPLVVGEVSKGKKLGKDTIYNRFSINCIALDSLEHLLDKVRLRIASKSVGTKIEIDRQRLRSLRLLNGLSLDDLAKSTNISKDTLYKLEKSGGYASGETVAKTEKRLGDVIRLNATNMEVRRYEVSGKSYKFGKTGVKAVRLNSSPFNIIGKGRYFYEVATDSNPRTMKKKAALLSDIHEHFEDNYQFFISSKKRSKFYGIRVLSKKKLDEIGSEDELLSEID